MRFPARPLADEVGLGRVLREPRRGAGVLLQAHQQRAYDLYEGEVPYKDLRYWTRILTERASQYIERRHEKPWLLNLNSTTPHWTWTAEGDTEEAARLEKAVRSGNTSAARLALVHLDGGSLDKYRQMVEGLDRSVGEVLKSLRRSGQERDTIAVFASDNGGERSSHNWPFNGAKSSLQEAGRHRTHSSTAATSFSTSARPPASGPTTPPGSPHCSPNSGPPWEKTNAGLLPCPTPA